MRDIINMLEEELTSKGLLLSLVFRQERVFRSLSQEGRMMVELSSKVVSTLWKKEMLTTGSR
jgi:hypothetical protein